jgi:serine/threonine-protein kinase
MATVYLAQDLRHDRLVALKVLHPELAAMLGLERFIREIRLTARLDHPHILPVLDSGDAAGLLWYTMPYVRGETLRDRLRREVHLPVDSAVDLTRQVASALDHAHREGVVHRDLKPENILLAEGQARVADFGVAKALAGAGDGQLTQTGLAVGTPAYMSPEQASGGVVDARSDVYALGCVLYEMLTGEPPFTGPTPQAIIAKRYVTPPPSVRLLRPDTPAAIETAVRKALAQVPADRFSSAGELAAGLAQVPQRAASRRSISVGRLVAAAAVVAVVALAAALTRGQPDEREAPVRNMLVVLPFENLGRVEDEYFADGMVDELNTRLASLQELGVIDRMSALRFKGSDKSVSEIGRELGVQYVLAGSVRWEKPPAGPSRVRISPRLIRVADGSPVWAKAYDAVLTGVFELQADVARQVAEQLDVALAAPERRTLEVRPTENLAAYDAFLRGRAYARRAASSSVDDWAEDLRLAIAQYTEAIRLDSTFLQAYTDLAIAHLELHTLERSASRAALAKAAIDRALALRQRSADARIALGRYHLQVGLDTITALRELAAAQKGKPNDAELLATIAEVQSRLRADTAALGTQARALALDPQSLAKTLTLAQMHSRLRQYDAAARLYDQAVQLDPRSAGSYIGKARIHLLRDGDPRRARAVLRAAARRVDSMTLVKTAATEQATWFALGMLDEPYQRALLTLPVEAFEAPAWHAIVKGYTYRARGDLDRARAYYDTALVAARARLAETGHPWDMVMTSWPSAVLGHKAEAYQLMRKGLSALPWRRPRPGEVNEFMARLYVFAGDYDSAAVELTREGTLSEELTVPWLRADPFWDPLRDDPRFRRLVAGAR